MTKTAICADFEIELTPKRVHEKVEMLKDCYRPYDLFSWQVLGLVSHKGLPICILRVVNRGGRAIKCYIRLWWCVVLPPTPQVMHRGPQHFVGCYTTLTGSYEHHMAPGSMSLSMFTISTSA